MKPILIIDPGHGGIDSGGGSNHYWLEKDLNLKISLYQYERFKELGIPVAITRIEDITIEPLKRTQLVKESGATYCLSNHINAGGGRGAEFIHSIYSNSNLSKTLAKELEASGQQIRRIFTRKLPNDNNKDYYYMHRDTGRVDTIIIEYGFADNKEDTNILLSRWECLAEAIVKGFCKYAGYDYRPPTEDHGQVSNIVEGSWEWALANGMMNGTRSEELITREEVANIIHRLYKMMLKEE